MVRDGSWRLLNIESKYQKELVNSTEQAKYIGCSLTYGTPKSAGKYPIVGDMENGLPCPFPVKIPNCGHNKKIQRRINKCNHSFNLTAQRRHAHIIRASSSELLSVWSLPPWTVRDAAVRHLLVGSADHGVEAFSPAASLKRRGIMTGTHRESTASAPLAYTGITFSSLIPALHTGHSEWFCIHCAQQIRSLELHEQSKHNSSISWLLPYLIQTWPTGRQKTENAERQGRKRRKAQSTEGSKLQKRTHQ